MIEFHTTLIAKRVATKCISFARQIHAKRLCCNLVHKQVLAAIAADSRELSPQRVDAIYCIVRRELAAHAVGIR